MRWHASTLRLRPIHQHYSQTTNYRSRRKTLQHIYMGNSQWREIADDQCVDCGDHMGGEHTTEAQKWLYGPYTVNAQSLATLIGRQCRGPYAKEDSYMDIFLAAFMEWTGAMPEDLVYAVRHARVCVGYWPPETDEEADVPRAPAQKEVS